MAAFRYDLDDYAELERILMVHAPQTSTGLDADIHDDLNKGDRKHLEPHTACFSAALHRFDNAGAPLHPLFPEICSIVGAEDCVVPLSPTLGRKMSAGEVTAARALTTALGEPQPQQTFANFPAPALPPINAVMSRAAAPIAKPGRPKLKGSSLRQCRGRDKLIEEFGSFVYDTDVDHETCKLSTDSKRSDYCSACRRFKRILVNRKMRFNKNPTSMHVAKKYLTPLREQRQSQHYQDELKASRRRLLSARKKAEAMQQLLGQTKKGAPYDELQKLVDHLMDDLVSPQS
jgi:hypothetical protein